MKSMQKRGIVLTISIILAVVMVMFVGAALGLGPGNMASSRQTAMRSQARRAAESGIQYALSQLKADPNWRGDKNTVTVSRPDLRVEEDNGNVIGVVQSPDGSWSQFRLRFNYQDGGADAENLPDPTLTIDHPYVSVNNLLGGTPAQVPRADGPGYSVTAGSARPFAIPLWAVSLAVEGRAGSPQLSPANPNPSNLPGASRVTLEAVYQVPDMGPFVKEAAVMAANNLQAVLGVDGKLVVTSAKEGRAPRLRSKAGVGVMGGDSSENYQSLGGRVATASGFFAAYDTSQVTMETENAADDFYSLTWDKVKKADPTQHTVPAGTYVWWEDGTLHYYDMSYQDYRTHIAANPLDAGTTPSLPSSITVSGSGTQKTLELHQSIYIEPTGATQDFSIIPRAGAAESFPADYVGGGSTTFKQLWKGESLASVPGSIPGIGMTTGLTSLLFEGGELYGYSGGGFGGGSGGFGGYGGYGGSSGYYGGGSYGGSSGSYGGSSGYYSGGSSGYPGGYSSSGSGSGGSGYPAGGSYGGSGYPAGGSYGGTTGGFSTTTGGSGTTTGGTTTGGTTTGGWISTITPDNGIIPLPPGVTDSLTASDLGIKFDGNGTQVVLSGEGNIRLTGTIDGKNGSITSGGEIRMTGLGADFTAGTNPEEGVNMYARGDIIFSSLDKAPDGTYGYDSVNLAGVVYTWGNFICDLGSPSSPTRGLFRMEGVMVAYGGDPSADPGNNGKGNVLLSVGAADLVFNPSYLGSLATELPANFGLKAISWNQLP